MAAALLAGMLFGPAIAATLSVSLALAIANGAGLSLPAVFGASLLVGAAPAGAALAVWLLCRWALPVPAPHASAPSCAAMVALLAVLSSTESLRALSEAVGATIGEGGGFKGRDLAPFVTATRELMAAALLTVSMTMLAVLSFELPVRAVTATLRGQRDDATGRAFRLFASVLILVWGWSAIQDGVSQRFERFISALGG